MRRINGDGVELSVLDEGEGPAVLLLHGFPDSARLWRHQIPTLTDAGFRVVAPDQRGYGDSDKPQAIDAYGFGHLVSDVLAVLDDAGVEKAHVVGHDWGAAVAWAIALLAPERVDRLVALSVGHPTAFAARGIEQRRLSWYMLLFQFEEAEALLRKDDWALMREWAASHPDLDAGDRGPRAPRRADRGAELVPREPAPARRARAARPAPARAGRHARRLQHRRRLPGRGADVRVRAPTSPASGATSASRAPGTGCMLEQPERVNALLLDFLK